MTCINPFRSTAIRRGTPRSTRLAVAVRAGMLALPLAWLPAASAGGAVPTVGTLGIATRHA